MVSSCFEWVFPALNGPLVNMHTGKCGLAKEGILGGGFSEWHLPVLINSDILKIPSSQGQGYGSVVEYMPCTFGVLNLISTTSKSVS